MQDDRFADKIQNLGTCFANGNTAGEIRYVGAEGRGALFDNDQVAHLMSPYLLRPACFKTLFSVPGGTSIPGLPATVTVPDFVG